MTPLFLLFLADAAAPRKCPLVPPEIARAPLGFSGATLTIRSEDDPKRCGTAFRRLTLTLPNGKTASMPLKPGGGYEDNMSLSLYAVDDDFLLVSQKDCVEIDPFKAVLKACVKQQSCARRREYTGRFDWMNAFDPPRGDFRFAFRYLPAHDASENSGC